MPRWRATPRSRRNADLAVTLGGEWAAGSLLERATHLSEGGLLITLKQA